MKPSAGKVSVTLIVAVTFLVGLGAIALTSNQTPTITAGQFMSALASGDFKTLADLSYAEGTSREELEKQWEYTMTVAAPHYQFTYEIKGESKPSKDSAIVWMMLSKNAGSTGSFDERFELPLVRTEDGWKVEVYGLNRDMFPGLPRG